MQKLCPHLSQEIKALVSLHTIILEIKSVLAPITIPLSSVPPTSTSLISLQQITQTASEYVIDLRIQSTLAERSMIVAYSAVLDRPYPDLKPISASGFFLADIQIRVPLSTPAAKTIDAVVKDNYGNESITQSITIQLR